RQQDFSLLSGLFLQAPVLERTRADTALQLHFPLETPSLRWLPGFSVIGAPLANGSRQFGARLRVVKHIRICSISNPGFDSHRKPSGQSWRALPVPKSRSWTTGPSSVPRTVTRLDLLAGRRTASPSSPATSTSSTPDIYGF